jgi:hypothetical protein
LAAVSRPAGTAQTESEALATVPPAPEATTVPVAGSAISKSTWPVPPAWLVKVPCKLGVVVPVLAESPGVMDRLSTGSGAV